MLEALQVLYTARRLDEAIRIQEETTQPKLNHIPTILDGDTQTTSDEMTQPGSTI